MAFNTQEQEIIKFGVQNGKSRQEVEQAIANYRTGVVKPLPTPTTPSFLERAKERVTTAGAGIEQKLTEGTNSPITRGVEATAQAFNVPLEVGYEALPQPVRTGLGKVGETIGKGFGWVVNKLSDTKLLKDLGELETQGFVDTSKLRDVLGAVGAGGQIAGDIAAYQGVAKGLQKGIDLTKVGMEKVEAGVEKVLPKIKESVGNLAGNKDSKLLSIFTGEDQRAIDTALRNPKIADLGIQQGDEALRNAVQKGGDASIAAKNEFIKGQSVASKAILSDVPTKVSRQKVLYQFVDDLKSAGVEIKNGKANFSLSKISANPGEVGKIMDAYKAIQGWNDWSVAGINDLKQLVGAYTRFATEAGIPSKSPFLGKFYKYLDTTIKTTLPEDKAAAYEALNAKFSQNIGLYDEMVDAFNSGDPFTRLAQLFGKNKDSLRQVVDFYEKTTGEQIAPIVAGRVLAESRPAAFGFLNPRQWIDFFIDPKTQASLVTKYGAFKNQLSLPNEVITANTPPISSGMTTAPTNIINKNIISPKSTIATQSVKSSPLSYAQGHIAEARDVLNANLPDFQQLGGMKGLLRQVKTNIVDGLNSMGQKTIANTINTGLDLSKINTLDELETILSKLLK